MKIEIDKRSGMDKVTEITIERLRVIRAATDRPYAAGVAAEAIDIIQRQASEIAKLKADMLEMSKSLDWQPVSVLPPRKTDMLLKWQAINTDDVTIVRMGQLSFVTSNDVPIFKTEVDFGDSGSWFFTSNDYCPTHWRLIGEL